MKLLLSVKGKSFPSMANKARGTQVNSCCQLASFKFNSGRERATLVIRAHCEGHPSFPQSCQRACASLHGFRALFQAFGSTFFTLAQRLTSVVLTRSSSKAVYFCWSISSRLHMYFYLWQHDDFRDDIDQLFVIVCHRIQKVFDHIFQFHYVFLLPSPNSQQQVMVYAA